MSAGQELPGRVSTPARSRIAVAYPYDQGFRGPRMLSCGQAGEAWLTHPRPDRTPPTVFAKSHPSGVRISPVVTGDLRLIGRRRMREAAHRITELVGDLEVEIDTARTKPNRPCWRSGARAGGGLAPERFAQRCWNVLECIDTEGLDVAALPPAYQSDRRLGGLQPSIFVVMGGFGPYADTSTLTAQRYNPRTVDTA